MSILVISPPGLVSVAPPPLYVHISYGTPKLVIKAVSVVALKPPTLLGKSILAEFLPGI